MPPVAILFPSAGVWLVKRTSPKEFHVAILTAPFLVGLKLVYDAVIVLVS